MRLPIHTAQLTEHDIAIALAKNQLGAKLPAQDFVDAHGIQLYEVQALSKSEHFISLVAAYKKELQEDNEGIRLKSAIALEACIPRLYKMVQHYGTPPAAVVSGVKQLAEMAGVTREEKAIAGTGFSVNIDLTGLREIADKMDASNQGKTVIEIQQERETQDE